MLTATAASHVGTAGMTLCMYACIQVGFRIEGRRTFPLSHPNTFVSRCKRRALHALTISSASCLRRHPRNNGPQATDVTTEITSRRLLPICTKHTRMYIHHYCGPSIVPLLNIFLCSSTTLSSRLLSSRNLFRLVALSVSLLHRLSLRSNPS